MKASNQEMSPLYGLKPDNAIDLLIADHKRVARLFAEFKRLVDEGDDQRKASVVKTICQELSVHAELEEELFYPAVREATGDEDQVDEAIVEHAGAKSLIAQLQSAAPGDELYDAKVTVLGEQINHHVEEEEGSMFPKARLSGLDVQALGKQMLTRKTELQSAAGGSLPKVASPEDEEELADEAAAPRVAPSRVKSKAAASKSKSPKAKPKRR